MFPALLSKGKNNLRGRSPVVWSVLNIRPKDHPRELFTRRQTVISHRRIGFPRRKRQGDVKWKPKLGSGNSENHCALVESAKEYTQHTSLHGLKYVGVEELHVAERCDWGCSVPQRITLFWIGAFVFGILAASYFITIQYNRWDDNPMIVSLSPSPILLNSIPFPSVTICNMNGAREAIAKDIAKSESQDALTLFEKQMINILCEDDVYDANVTDEMPDANWTEIQRFIIKVSQPCQEMLISCKWKNKDLPCMDLFNPELTDEGMCCIFNKVKPEFIYRNTTPLDGINQTFPHPRIDWTPEKGYPSDTPKNAYPWRAAGTGMSMGLTVVLDAALDEYYCSSTASAGFKMLLHNPIETPKISDFAYFLTPGLETRVEILPKISSSTRSLVYIPQAKRQCFFSSDRQLRFFRTYTQRNCEMECQSNFTLFHCKCVPFYLPRDDSIRICGTLDIGCISRVKAILNHHQKDEINSTEWNVDELDMCSCFPGCVQIQYDKQLSTSKLDDIFRVKKNFLNGKNLKYYKKNMAVVHFFFQENSFIGFEKGEIFGFTDFLSNTGGLLGLFIGFSFMSAAEIIYFMSLRLFCSVYRRKLPDRSNQVRLPRFPFTY